MRYDIQLMLQTNARWPILYLQILLAANAFGYDALALSGFTLRALIHSRLFWAELELSLFASKSTTPLH